MTHPERSAALAKALAEDTGLPADFPQRVAALAEARDTAHRAVWNYAGLTAAFVAMLGVCVWGWYLLEPQASAMGEWFEPILRTMAAEPWLVIAVTGIAVVQALTFRRRATI
jgi:hypothetical protein